MSRYLILLVFLSGSLAAQQWEQVYPEINVSDVECLLHWNGDTVFAAGRNTMFLQSTDAGTTWHELLPEKRGLDIVKMMQYRDGILLIPRVETFSWIDWEGDDLFSVYYYRPSDGSVVTVTDTIDFRGQIPYYDTYTAEYVLVSTVGESIVFLGASHSGTRTIRHMTSDLGQTWERTDLWGSEQYIGYQARMHSNSRGDLFLVAPTQHQWNSLFLWKSIDSGRTWNKILEDELDGGLHRFQTTQSGSGEIIALGNTNHTYLSSDGGDAWSRVEDIDWQDDVFVDLCFTDQSAGAAFGRDGSINFTSDLGASWSRIATDDFINVPSVLCNTGLLFNSSRGMRYIRGLTAGVIETSANGADWETKRATDIARIAGVRMFNRTHGVLFAERREPLSSANHVYETADGGETWTYVHEMNLPKVLTIYTPLPAAWFACESWKAGEYRVVLSSDYGATWEVRTQWTRNDPENGYNMYVLDSQHLYVKSIDGTNVSTDGGTTWAFYPDNDDDLGDGRENPASSLKESIIMKDPDSGYIISGDRLYRTSDGCKTWSLVSTFPESVYQYRQFHLLSMDTLVLHALNDTSNHRELLISTNGGVDWTFLDNWVESEYSFMQSHGDGYALGIDNSVFSLENFTFSPERALRYYSSLGRGMEFIKDGSGWVFAGNALFRSTGEAVTPLAEIPIGQTTHWTVGLYPHPLVQGRTAMISIQSETSQQEPVDIVLYDGNGRLVEEIKHVDIVQGHAEYPWEVRPSIRAGIYVLCIKSDRGLRAGRMLLIH